MTRTTDGQTRRRPAAPGATRPAPASPGADDWRLAHHDFYLALPARARGEARPYPIAMPAAGPDPTGPEADPFLPLASPRPSSAQRLTTATALATFGFDRLHGAVRSCDRRSRDRRRATSEDRTGAKAAAARIERLAASVSRADAVAIEVCWNSPRAPLPARSTMATPRIRLRITGADDAEGRCPLPLTLDVDPTDPLVHATIAGGDGRRIDVAPPGLGRLARVAAADGAGFRPPGLSGETLLAAARAHAAGGTVSVTTRAVDPEVEPDLEACAPEGLAKLLLPCCWPHLTPTDPRSAWIAQLAKPANGPGTALRTALARYDRATNAILIDEQPLEPDDEHAVAGLVAALRTAGRYPGARYWTHHRTRYPIGFGGPKT